MADIPNTGRMSFLLNKVGNPLNWSRVDRCLLILSLGFFLQIGMFLRALFGMQALEPYLNTRYFDLGFITYILVFSFNTILIFVGLFLRNKNPNNALYTHIAIQTQMFSIAIFCYSVGLLTHPSIIFAITAGVIYLLFFKQSFSAPSIYAFSLTFILLAGATQLKLIPYAPLFARIPMVKGRLEWDYAAGTGVSIIVFYLLTLGLIGYIFGLWQKREKEVKIYSEALQTELEKGRKIQRDFLPNQIPRISNCEIVSYFDPALQLSGDFYDVFRLPQNKIGMVIADVSDKGVGSALFMALLRSLIRVFSGHALFHRVAEDDHDDSHLVLKDWDGTRDQDQVDALSAVSKTNDYVSHEHGEEGMFATLFFGVFDPMTGELVYVNGGHEPLFIIGLDGIKRRLKPTGPAVGTIPGFNYQIGREKLETGEILFGFTDGVTEARSPFDELYTRERLEETVEDCRLQSAEGLLEKVKANLFGFIGQAPQSDDITMLALRWS